MAEAVARSLRDEKPLVVEAGTGTGKSLAYLVPIVLSGRKTVVATATKALQDQLAGKDLPFVAEHLGIDFEFAVLKGRSNYVCRQRIGEIESETQLALDGLAQQAPADELRRLRTIVAAYRRLAHHGGFLIDGASRVFDGLRLILVEMGDGAPEHRHQRRIQRATDRVHVLENEVVLFDAKDVGRDRYVPEHVEGTHLLSLGDGPPRHTRG